MKITKTFVSVFLVTFVIGYVFVPTAKKESIAPDVTENVMPEKVPTPAAEKKFKPEIFDVPDFSSDEVRRFKVKLLKVGDGHQKIDSKAKSGETWLGFYRSGNNYFLRSEKIKVYPTNKPDFGKDSISIAVNSRIKPIVLIKNAKGLRDGEVKTLFSRPFSDEAVNSDKDDSLLISGYVKEFKLGEKKYTLRIKQAIDRENYKFLALALETENKSQIIQYCPYFEADEYSNMQGEDYLGNLIWVGDMDNDGKLDLYLDYYTHERGEETMLFLSSEAEKGKLIKKVAEYSPTGC